MAAEDFFSFLGTFSRLTCKPYVRYVFGVTHVDDKFLIQQTLNGNRNAFRFLVLRYQKPIFKILGTLIYDKQLVEEIAQETFLRAYRALSSFDPTLGTSFST